MLHTIALHMCCNVLRFRNTMIPKVSFLPCTRMDHSQMEGNRIVGFDMLHHQLLALWLFAVEKHQWLCLLVARIPALLLAQAADRRVELMVWVSGWNR